MRRIAVLLWAALFCAGPASAEGSKGQFIGEIVSTMMPDGRNLRLVQPFSYVDPDGVRWDVPAGTETDGASIPRAFWVAYPPFTGKYRQAAVVHDYYCQTQARDWKPTHKVFYDAMRTAGVDDATAKVMYGAVYYMGPRWGFGTQTRGLSDAPIPDEKEQLEFMNRLETWVKRDNPTPEQIEKAMESGRVP